MRSLRHLVFLILLPATASANPIPIGWFFGNSGGTMTFNPTTQRLRLTSTITSIIGVIEGKEVEDTGTNFGTITISVGPLISGTIFQNALFDGGTIAIVSDGSHHFADVVMFGALNTPLKWRVNEAGQSQLSGFGHLNGVGPIQDFGQLAVSSGANHYNVIQGRTGIPEPSTLVLVATGLGLLVGTRRRSEHPRARAR